MRACVRACVRVQEERERERGGAEMERWKGERWAGERERERETGGGGGRGGGGGGRQLDREGDKVQILALFVCVDLKCRKSIYALRLCGYYFQEENQFS